MRLTNIDNVKEFLAIVDNCKGDVYLTSQYGDHYNLKSKLTQYVAVGALLNKDGSALELFCTDKQDEIAFLNFFGHYPETI